MRIAILSDIHGNLEALETALRIIAERNIDEIICLGDIVGYGANPNQCLDLLLQHTRHFVMGNHEEAAVHLEAAENFSPYARIAIEWTSSQLTSSHKHFLYTLPLTLERHDILFVHASPFDPQQWYYIEKPEAVRNNFLHFSQQLCFIGHSHIPAVYCEDSQTMEVTNEKRFLINVGSVGQPRDRYIKLSFGIFDTYTWKYENIRASYDINTAASKIYAAGLPMMLGDRLFEGK